MQLSYPIIFGFLLSALSYILLLFFVIKGGRVLYRAEFSNQEELSTVETFYLKIASRRSTHVLFYLGFFVISFGLAILPGVIAIPMEVVPFLLDYWWFFAITAVNYSLIPFLLTRTWTDEAEEEERAYWEEREKQ